MTQPKQTPEEARRVKRVYMEPVIVDGAVARLVSDGTTVWAEVWRDGAWFGPVDGVDEVMRAPSATTDRLAAFGVPPCSVGDIVSDRPSGPQGRPPDAQPVFFAKARPFPTVEQFVELTRRLTGREPSEAEIAAARRAHAKAIAKLRAEGREPASDDSA